MLKNISLVFGIIFAIVGIWGFFSPEVLGFSVNQLHSLVHLVVGLWLLWAALKDEKQLPLAAQVIGVVYLIIAILGFLKVQFLVDSLVLNDADNWLHLIVGLILAYFGFMVKSRKA